MSRPRARRPSLPGSRPFDELAAALRSVARERASVATVPSARELLENRGVIVEEVKALVPADCRLLLVVVTLAARR